MLHRSIRSWLARTATAALLASTPACLSPADDVVATDEIAQPINGGHSYVNCSATEQTALTNALTYATSTMATSAYRECMKHAFMVETHGYLVEDIISRLQAMPDTITCADTCDGGAASALGGPYTGGPNSEEMCVRHATIASYPLANLAGVIAHEAAHEQGWDHVAAGEIPYPFSVPEQVNACLRSGVQNGFSRADLRHDSELPKMGGEGGSNFGLWCPSGLRATGITAQADTTAILGFTLLCGNGVSAGHVGGFGGTTVQRTCPTGQSIAGFTGRSGTLVSSLSVGCESDADLVANLSNGFSSWTSLGGSSTGTQVDRSCPVGKAVIGAVGRAGSYVGSVRWICGDIDGPAIPVPHTITRVGVADAGTVGTDNLCAGYGALTTLLGRAGGEVDQITGLCAPRAAGLGPNGDVVLENAGPATDHVLDTAGGTGGSTFQLPCAAHEAVVGIRVRADARITAVGAVCAPTGSWSHGITTGQTNLPLQGGPGGTYTVVTCPASEFVTGIESYVKSTPQIAGSPVTVHALSPICRRLN